MNQEELQQKIAEYYAKLPKKAQEVFSGMQWLQTLEDISNKYNLTEEHKQSLGTETMLALLGITPVNEYEGILVKEIPMPKEKMESMLDEINTLVLNSIRKDLSQAFEANVVDYGKQEEAKKGKKEEVGQKKNEVVTATPNKAVSETPVKSILNVQKVIDDSDYKSKIYLIGKENNLTVAEMTVLEELTTKIISGSMSPSVFEEQVKKEINLPAEKINTVISAINEKILKVLRAKMINPTISQTPKEEGDKNALGVLKQAGIEIIPNETVVKKVAPETKVESREEIIKKVENPNDKIQTSVKPTTPSLITQKFGGTFQKPSVKTEYSLGSINKTTQSNPSTQPKIDPYRMSPEE